MAKTSVGLEITEECVRAVEVTTGRKPQVVAYGEVPLPAEAARDSEVEDSGAVASALRQLWHTARIKNRDVTLGIASRRTLVREYSTTAMSPELLKQALPYQVQDLLPVPVNQAVLDFYPLGLRGDQVNGLLVAAVSDTIEQIIATLARAKLRARAVDLSAFGLARASASIADPAETIAVVNVGDHTTQVVVATGGVPQFVRIIPVDIATPAVTRRLSRVAGLDPAAALVSAGSPSAPLAESAETPMVTSGILPRTRTERRVSLPDPSSTDVAARVRSTLAFYRGRPDALTVSRLIVVGPGAAAHGLLSALSTAVDIPVRSVGLDTIAAIRAAPPTGELSLSLVSTFGIALGEDL